MQTGKGWHEWYVSVDYLPKALDHLDENNVETKNIFIVPYSLGTMKADYIILYKTFYDVKPKCMSNYK